ncbi:c-type cytochrome [Halomonas korlensis]|uniref:Cytochrome c, mono-and diheme variants n=1 Tax=Halomonas korlensis TaxID=463301 RepID=A0A1I7IC19_9GAMM|nr:cytochrome c [Halomonas korlensis]SFU70376.1 Cytochrome c, mono-and diheme variants [Halomonas korlensis]
MSERRHKTNDGQEHAAEEFEPYEMHNPVPWPLIALALALAVWGILTLYSTQEAAQDTPPVQQTQGQAQSGGQQAKGRSEAGEALFSSHCATCHQVNGSGIRGAVPPLAGSPYVTNSADVPISIVLFGIENEIEVAGNTYNGLMPTFGHTLDDAQIAAIVSYIRGNWGNDAMPVESSLVSTLRERFAGRDQPWNGGAELAQLFDTGATDQTSANLEETR